MHTDNKHTLNFVRICILGVGQFGLLCLFSLHVHFIETIHRSQTT